MDTNIRRRLAETTLKNIFSALQELEQLERAKALGLMGVRSASERESLADIAKALGMPLAAERIVQVANVTVAPGF